MRLTFLEQSRVPIGRSPGVGPASLGPDEASALVDLGESMGARIASWHGARAVQIHQFVGAVRMGDLHAEILPKIDGLDGPEAIRRSLLAMLAKTQDLEVRESEAAGILESAEPFICVLARLYCRRLFEAVRLGLRQEYVAHDELLPVLRGKVHWPSQARRQASQRLEFRCLFDERLADTPLNRTLKAALLAAEMMLEGAAATSDAVELRHLLADVSDACPPREVVARLRTDRMSRRLAPLLALAKLILGNRSPDLGRATTGDRRSYAVVWDIRPLRGVRGARLPGRPRAEGPRRRPAGGGLPPSRGGSGDEAKDVPPEAGHPRPDGPPPPRRRRHEVEAPRPAE
ncbi:MAG: hypothetical protein KBB14_11735, partial [Thermoanaerobaculia bacterium]|nr:hypothetical protein [Thermoanaerobaculia bacterium]